jgi:hypothetical protein
MKINWGTLITYSVIIILAGLFWWAIIKRIIEIV